MEGSITIRPLTTYDEFLACEEIQRQAWAMTDSRDIVPAHMLSPIQKYGGIVLGACSPEDQLVGFLFGFLGRTDDERAAWMGTPYLHCSEMMGVLPAYRNHSVGYRLKLAQREHVLAQGYRLIVWTYDPLLSLNARLNIGKLGVVCRRYIRDAYGQLGGIYAGLPTDRLEAEWWLDSEHVHSHLTATFPEPSLAGWLKAGAQPINPIAWRNRLPIPPETLDSLTGPILLVEIPSEFQTIKQADPELALRWRLHIRQAFEMAFETGYVATRFVTDDSGEARRSFYILTNKVDMPSWVGGRHAG